MAQVLANLTGLVITWMVWWWLAALPADPMLCLVGAAGGVLALLPVIFVGRKALDRQKDPAGAVRVTSAVHYLVAISMGGALVLATRFCLNWPAWELPVPPWIGLAIMAPSAVFLFITLLNLVVKGLGLPFALALTRVLASDWVYAWTRNPMVLSALAFLTGLGLWLRSGLFLFWLLILLSPVMLLFLTVYEERELELRFGQAYLVYKARTPRLSPRRPQPTATKDSPITPPSGPGNTRGE